MVDSVPMPQGTGDELKAVMLLRKGEIIKFPCRWKHTEIRCIGANAVHKVANRKGFRVQPRCIDKFVYVRRLSEREEAAKNHRQQVLRDAKMRDGFSTPTNMVSGMLEREAEVQGSTSIGGSQSLETT